MRTLYPDGTMFSYSLAESRTSLSSAFHSTVIHGLLISGAIWGTKTVVVDRPTRDPFIDLTFLTPAGHPQPACNCIPVTAPTTIPSIPATITGLPPIDPHLPGVDHPPIDPRSFGQVGLPTGFAGTGGDSISASSVLEESVVDERPTLLTAGPLRYPAVLMASGIEGSVTLSFIIDTEGRVEADGIEVISATQPGFIPAAKEAVTASRFEPARKGRQAVRVRVRQTVTFRR